MKKFNTEHQLSLFGGDVLELAEPPVTVAEKKPVAKAVSESLNPPRELFQLNDSHLADLKGPKSKVIANLAAIKVITDGGEVTAEDKAKLAAYSGWGGLSSVFAHTGEFHNEQKMLLEMVGPEAYATARESVLTAYYTEPEVIQNVWRVVRSLGFEGGRVLDPCTGTGNFIGAMPKDMRENSRITMVEPDMVSSKIARALYGDSQTIVLGSGIETTPIRSESYDLVIGNVPFGNYRVHDSKFDRLKLTIHDYFFAKAIDAVRPGGIVAFITSVGTLDKATASFREYLMERADLVTAIRLPTGAFSRLGGTDVATDIIVLRRKPEIDDGFKGADITCVKPYTFHDFGGGYSHMRPFMNQFFLENNDCMLGLPRPSTNQYGDTVSFAAVPGWQGKLGDLCSSQGVAGLYKHIAPVECTQRREALGDTGLKSFVASGYFLDEAGVLQYMSQGYVEGQQHLPTATRKRLEGMTRIRDVAVELLEVESVGGDGAAKRAELNRVYDDFESQYGYLMRPVNRRLFSLDSHAPLVWSLERYDDEEDKAVKTDLFRKSTVSRAVLADTAESLSDAIALSYNRFARLNIEFMATAMGADEESVINELLAEKRAFFDPESQGYVDSEVYLSGKVREKLDFAHAASEGDARYRQNVTSLEAVVPATVPLASVGIQLGVPWIGAEYIEAFVAEVVTASETIVTISHLPAMATWVVSANKWVRKQALFSSDWGTDKAPFPDLLSDLLNQKHTTIYKKVSYTDDQGVEKTKQVVDQDQTMAARDKAERIQAEFKSWVMASEERVKALEEIYNRTYNGTVNRSYDGSHLVIPGLSPVIQLRDAQKAGVWRCLVSGNTLLAHAVGGGKTLEEICAAQESKRLGLANKPMLIVPNHMLEGFAGEYARAFPRARILAASKQDLDGEKRKRLMMRIATEDWDCVILTHSSFGKIAPDPDAVKAFADEVGSKLVESVMGAEDKNAVREAERQKKMVIAKLMVLADSKSKDTGLLTFDMLGVDMLIVDEADLFKNLWFHTKKTRVSGLSNTCSIRALDLFIKSRMIFDRREWDGFGMVFGTATPIANTIAEMFIMQTYLQPTRLAELAIDSFDAWAANFAREVTSIEVSPEGSGYRMHSRFAQFVNVPELMLIFKEVADIRTKRMLNLPEPTLAGGQHSVVGVPASEAQKAFVQTLVARAMAIRNGEVKPNEDNMLCVTGDGRKAALDMRCVDPWSKDFAGSKVNACIQNVYRHWEDGRDNRLTQLVFSDLSTPKKVGFSVYGHIREKLLEKGVPVEQIAFAQDYDSDAQKAELHRKVRSGKIRILIGSTELMGFGTNVQDRLVAEHHLDAPWRPRDVEQRDGRILRQGNLNDEVHIYRYVTESTFDAYMWQTLERKAGFIAQVMEGKSEMRSVEDVTSQALSFAEVKAIASGNPLVIEKAGIDAEVTKIVTLKSVWRDNQRVLADKVAYAQGAMEFTARRIAGLEADTENGCNSSQVTVAGNVMDASEKSAKAVMNILAAAKAAVITNKFERKLVEDVFAIGTMKIGFVSQGKLGNCSFDFFAKGNSGLSYDFRLPYGAESIENFLKSQRLEEVLVQELSSNRSLLKEYGADLENVRRELAKPFQYEDRLVAAIQKQMEIDTALGLMSDDVSALQLEEETA